MPEPPVAQVAEPQPAAARIPWLEELPGEVRRALPGLSINVHVYNREPARRFVLIGMRKYREGQRIGEDGPVVERITPEGMVIDYGAGLAQVRSNR
ncbi:general secretion pathway protein GspB [Thioalbus denitrificans]|uniref:general secretion pathway protein GspB n=1 Tax=Thioalbus denitrificans TaxID=547122 RepID=UPI000DF35815|nr:general secretion pathway protein GspB [Thioalbus denitrificans]